MPTASIAFSYSRAAPGSSPLLAIENCTSWSSGRLQIFSCKQKLRELFDFKLHTSFGRLVLQWCTCTTKCYVGGHVSEIVYQVSENKTVSHWQNKWVSHHPIQGKSWLLGTFGHWSCLSFLKWQVYHLRSRWCNSNVLVYHRPLPSHLFHYGVIKSPTIWGRFHEPDKHKVGDLWCLSMRKKTCQCFHVLATNLNFPVSADFPYTTDIFCCNVTWDHYDSLRLLISSTPSITYASRQKSEEI